MGPEEVHEILTSPEHMLSVDESIKEVSGRDSMVGSLHSDYILPVPSGRLHNPPRQDCQWGSCEIDSKQSHALARYADT